MTHRIYALAAIVIACIIGYIILAATNHPVQAHQFGDAAFWGVLALCFFLL